MIGPPGQPEAVHGNGGDGGIGHLEFDTVVNGPGLVVGNGKDGAGNQLFELILGDLNGAAVVDIGKLGVILRVLGGDGKGGKACPDGHLERGVHHHGHRTLRQSADDIAKELGRQNTGAGLHHIGIDIIGDAGFHIIAGEGNALTGLAEDAFNQR